MPFVGGPPTYVSPAQPPAGPGGPVTWRTLPDGAIEVLEEGVLMPRTPAHVARLRKVVGKWQALAAENSARTGVPASWILAFIDSESWGDPTVESPVGAVGLMQLMPSWWRGHTKEEMKVAATNAAIGTDLLRQISTSSGVAGELPKAASVYNCGSNDATNTPRLRPGTRWGMCAEGWYLDDVVRASNWIVRAGETPAASTSSGPSGPLAIGAVAALAWFLLRGPR